MRTTIVLDDQLGVRLKKKISMRKLSAFVNACLREHFEREGEEKRLDDLEKAYRRASLSLKKTNEWDRPDIEEWPEW
ncbi:MAG: hypothetical protein HY541_03615 [Deltaproteobacteria bacterium]|nr:hypothetical protein [Deltaproteobacteria bacterium]